RNANQDFTNYSLGFRACRFYQQPEISWVCIDDPGVSGYEGFTGYMSKYETTNAQFCQFLNAALASGDIYVNDRWVYGANGFNSGADFLDQVYYNLAGLGFTSTGVTSGGASRINYTGSAFTVDSGFENHPVTYVSWYGAKAFCNYYGWRLPSKWQWQAVADYDGSYTYGCGNIINQTLANYSDSIHPDGTTAVGSFGAYGYGLCDMAGNVLEWTDSSYFNDNFRISCAGGWDKARCDCTVSYTFYSTRQFSYGSLGFRVCR
ncbi:MAG TPA: SUMF1/EgtB/PvdO family nonheme iron enzyme, partial [Sedimentisphaerales bacterium]|nr:SUMF1/EgtB/PvdO family nonheme iron enzyme [Sedimentisphaerales bacterium]